MKFLLSLLTVIIGFTSFSQDYEEYYQNVNKAEQLFVEKRDGSCFKLYDKAFQKNKPFLKDPYIAAQIAWFLNDTARFYNYLGICFRNSMPLTAVDASPLLRSGLTPTVRNKIALIHQKEFCAVKRDLITEKLCLACYQSDSIKMYMDLNPAEIQKFYKSENATRKFIKDSMLVKGLFPNEHYMEISSAKGYLDFHKNYNRPDLYAEYGFVAKTEYELRVACPYNIVVHSHCFFQQNFTLLFEAVRKGFLHPKDFGILEETSILWYSKDENSEDQCDKPEIKTCYNIFGPDPRFSGMFSETEEGLKKVEFNRGRIFMQRYAIDVQKKKLETELGFAFFFDFIDRQ